MRVNRKLIHEEYIRAQLSDDFIFKKVMSNEVILQGFLERVVDKRINKLVEIIPNYELFEFMDCHKIICDMYARDDAGRIYIVECQNYSIKSFINRLEYYSQLIGAASFNRKEHPNTSNDYKSLPEIYCIWICHKNPLKEEYGIMNGTKVILEPNISLYNHQRQIILSRDCIEDIEDEGIRDFLRLVGDTTEENALHSSWDMIHLIYKEYNRVKQNTESEEQYMLDYDDQVYYETRGIEKGKKETIINMYLEGLELSLISKVTNCSIDEVKKIINTIVIA